MPRKKNPNPRHIPENSQLTIGLTNVNVRPLSDVDSNSSVDEILSDLEPNDHLSKISVFGVYPGCDLSSNKLFSYISKKLKKFVWI